MAKSQWLAAVCILLNQSCAALYRAQLSDIEGGVRGRPISIKVSETTVDFREAADIANRLGRASSSKGMGEVGKAADTYTTLFQFGPRTGAPVFNEFYARDIPEKLAAECKNGYLTNVLSLREARNYPVIKGEIVRIDATCVQP